METVRPSRSKPPHGAGVRAHQTRASRAARERRLNRVMPLGCTRHLIPRYGPHPAVIVGCPVGFIGAAESKAALAALRVDHGIDIPFVTVLGRRGGSAMTSSALDTPGCKPRPS